MHDEGNVEVQRGHRLKVEKIILLVAVSNHDSNQTVKVGSPRDEIDVIYSKFFFHSIRAREGENQHETRSFPVTTN